MNAKISLLCVKWWWEITLSKMQNGWVHGPQQQNARLRPGNLAEWGQTRASGGQILSIIEVSAVVFLRLMDSQQNHRFNFQRHIKEILLQLENEWKSNSTHRHGLLLCPGGQYDDSTKKNTQFNSQSTTSATKVEAREKPALKGVPAAVVQVVFKRIYSLT